MRATSGRISGLRMRRAAPDESAREALFATYAEALRPDIESSLGWHFDSQRSRFDSLYPSVNIKEICLHETGVGFLSLERRSSSLHVRLLVLNPENRGNGIGSEVLRRIELVAKRAGLNVTLSAFVENERTTLFYQRRGYELVAADMHFVSLIKQTAAAR